MEVNEIHHIEALAGLQKMEAESVQCCVTSPPYWGLRDYGMAGQLGLEKTPEEYIATMVQIFREVSRVLQKDGTLWLNIGDSYASNYKKRNDEQACRKSNLKGGLNSQIACKNQISKITGDLKAKDLVGIPWLLAFALRADGWYLRQDIIWSKPNPMPESVTDRCTKSHEYIFLLSKSAKYYYDAKAIYKKASINTNARMSQDVQNQVGSVRAYGGMKHNGNMKAGMRKVANPGEGIKNNSLFDAAMVIMPDIVNKKSVWTVATMPFKEAHFATFPEDLIVDCIKAGCPENGIVLDPFMGAGTTALVARKLNRNFIGFELNPSYVKIAKKRLKKELGMFY